MSCPNLAGVDLLAAARCRTLYNGVKMPLIGLGTWRLRGDRLRSGVFGALNERYGLIDSAAVYGNEEEIRQLLKDAGNPRVFLTSKLQPGDAQGKDAVLKAFEKTIERLGVKQLDLYLIHWPGSGGVDANSKVNRQRRIESWRALEQLYEEKKVRAIGVSNFLVPHLEQLMEDGAKIRPMVNQVEWHPMCWVPDLIPYARKHSIVLQAYSSLGSGENRLFEHEVVKEIAEEVNEAPSVVLLRWALQQGLLVIPCSTSQEHLRENLAALDVVLSEDQMERLCAIRESVTHRFCWDPNTIA
ncbi:aldo/keto reductase family oxidoreductase, putative [Eimeria maxima]|uniref:Aldo/keto reductase family oxidoreductase, putative n=1 Tax=Eimeria maxima TaxID=5804 RepID=U6M2W4_EIMMA|nr:aldo/keto reductase family oxidoreductase, putative [Eimeria maxima]CDJ57423.1 aldo/keto reductase family oxidoreductase, putative [Eimeria maxima]